MRESFSPGATWTCKRCGHEWLVRDSQGRLNSVLCPCRTEERTELKAERMLAEHGGENL